MKSHPVFWFLVRMFIGIVFAGAGFFKLTEPIENFRGMLAEYNVIPYALVPAVAVLVPWIELFVGIFLILGFAVRVASVAAGMMSFGFLIVIGASGVLLENPFEACGCFGQEGMIQLAVWQVFVLDTAMLIFSFGLFRLGQYPASLESFLSGKRERE